MKLPLSLLSLVALAGSLSAQSSNPTSVPDRVILTWSGDTATTQSVTWRTTTGVKEGIGQIAETAPGPSFDPLNSKDAPANGVKIVPAKTELLVTSSNEAHYHSVTFTGLKPGTKYVYRVGGKPSWSEWFQFETASDKAEPFGFIYVGDAQDEIKRHWSRLIRQAYSDMPKAKFILHAGDLVSSGTSDSQWGEWHTAAGWINGCVPSIPSPGNHEYGSPPKTLEELKADARDALLGVGITEPRKPKPSIVAPNWRAQFTLPQQGPPGLEETCYYLDVQGVRMICLNSMERQQDQAPWLEAVLKDNPNKWTIVTFHVPLYSTANGRAKGDADKGVRKYWRPIFDRYAVDLILQGHDHCYGRSGLMRDDNPLGATEYDQKGTVYVVSVSGPKLYDLGLQPWMVSSAEKKQFYQLIRIDGERLRFESHTADGVLYDHFEIHKREDGAIKLFEHGQVDSEGARGFFSGKGEILVSLAALASIAALIAVARRRRKVATPV